METICPLPAEPTVPESRILHRDCQEREKGSGERVGFFFFHPATGDLYLIPSTALNLLTALCLRQPPLPPFIHRNFSLVSPPPFYSSAPPPSLLPAPTCDSLPVPSAFSSAALLPAAELRLLSSPSLFMVLSLRPGPLPETVKGHLLANLTGAAALASSR